MNPYKPRSGIAAPSVSERYVTGRVGEQPYPYKLRSGIKKRIPHMQAGETCIWGGCILEIASYPLAGL